MTRAQRLERAAVAFREMLDTRSQANKAYEAYSSACDKWRKEGGKVLGIALTEKAFERLLELMDGAEE